jgi:hypothetical protein
MLQAKCLISVNKKRSEDGKEREEKRGEGRKKYCSVNGLLRNRPTQKKAVICCRS